MYNTFRTVRKSTSIGERNSNRHGKASVIMYAHTQIYIHVHNHTHIVHNHIIVCDISWLNKNVKQNQMETNRCYALIDKR